jgi:hypothetical protein
MTIICESGRHSAIGIAPMFHAIDRNGTGYVVYVVENAIYPYT